MLEGGGVKEVEETVLQQKPQFAKTETSSKTSPALGETPLNNVTVAIVTVLIYAFTIAILENQITIK